ncbi:hypothetical protein DFS34DRAFT_335874 [Phlyctochytrium arcticum]|nr:hypothetical protein DFS34DRAFT_335874 [Phlyctochytrium arcticum]
MSKQLGKSLLRSAKNYTKGYSDMQIKVRQATSNDPWGPSGSLMAEISQSSYNHRDFLEIMEMIDKRLNDHGKNWRHVFKALTLLDYLLHTGSEAVIAYARENLYVIKTLKEFQYIDDDGKDQGANVRQKCKDITALLADESRLREARQTRADMRGRMTEGSGPAAAASGSAGGNGTYYNEDRELQKALEESRKTAQTDESRRKAMTQEELDVQKALELSEKEAIERRMRERDEAVKNEKKDDNIIDFFGGLEDTTPANPYGQQPQQQQQQGGGYDPFAGFGGNDVFAQQQQQYQQQYMMQQQQQQQLQQQLAQQQALQQQQMQNQMFNQAQQSNPFGGTPFGQASNAGQQQQQIPEGSDALARGSGPIDPFASLAASRTSQNTGSGSVSGSTQFNPFGGSSSGTQV